MSKELTDAWKAGKLKWHASYYCINPKSEVVVATLLDDNNLYSKELGGTLNIGYWEVLAPCDYNTLVHLETKAEWQAERIKEIQQDVKTLTNNYKLLEKQQAENLAHGQALVDEFGDFEALYEEVVRLRKEVAKGDEIIGKLLNEGHAAIEKNKQLSCLLKECDSCVRTLRAFGVSDCNGSNLNDLLTRINAIIGESEE